MHRPSFDQALARSDGPYCIVDRFTQQDVKLSTDDFDDLCRVHLYDWLEQVPRSKWWDYRREAYERMATKLGGIARKSYDQVFNEVRDGSR
jgi:hypothetical protein